MVDIFSRLGHLVVGFSNCGVEYPTSEEVGFTSANRQHGRLSLARTTEYLRTNFKLNIARTRQGRKENHQRNHHPLPCRSPPASVPIRHFHAETFDKRSKSAPPWPVHITFPPLRSTCFPETQDKLSPATSLSVVQDHQSSRVASPSPHYRLLKGPSGLAEQKIGILPRPPPYSLCNHDSRAIVGLSRLSWSRLPSFSEPEILCARRDAKNKTHINQGREKKKVTACASTRSSTTTTSTPARTRPASSPDTRIALPPPSTRPPTNTRLVLPPPSLRLPRPQARTRARGGTASSRRPAARGRAGCRISMGDGCAASVSAGGTFTDPAIIGRRGVLIRFAIMIFVRIALLICRADAPLLFFPLFYAFSMASFYARANYTSKRRGLGEAGGRVTRKPGKSLCRAYKLVFVTSRSHDRPCLS